MELPTRTIDSITDEAVARIRAVVQPERVLLFGSWARGEAGPDSDLDLLIVASFSGSRNEVGLAVLRALADLPVPTDAVVLRPEEWEAWRSVPGTVAYPADQDGRLLYEA